GCSKFASKNHPDLLVLEPDGVSIKIRQIRQLKKDLIYPPLEAPQRVIIIKGVHTMRREAGNSLLKLLEEPPPDNILLLVADDTEPLLSTIVSRCQVVPFHSLALEDALQVVLRIHPEISREDGLVLVSLAEGCPGRALELQDDEVLSIRHEVIKVLIDAADGDVRNVEKALILALKTAALEGGLESFFDLLLIYFKDVTIRSAGVVRQGPLSDSMERELEMGRERWKLGRLSDNMRAIDEAKLALNRNCNRNLVCEVLFLRLLAPDPDIMGLMG
ncbi:MAG: hypothetical protein OEM02_01575, partial [Desulfobulbaceae bacterium]|nr:hypothetical protein [Desulfobulbaceae bacterium]